MRGGGGPGARGPVSEDARGWGAPFRVGEEVEVALGAEQRGAGSCVGGGRQGAGSKGPRGRILKGRGLKATGRGLERVGLEIFQSTGEVGKKALNKVLMMNFTTSEVCLGALSFP